MADSADDKPLLTVVVGVIFNSDQQILLTQRPHHVVHGGLWEFPGGKVEPDETAHEALIRELHEEVGIDVIAAELVMTIFHEYPKTKVRLIVFKVTEFNGLPCTRESQLAIQWVQAKELKNFDFPQANRAIVERFGET